MKRDILIVCVTIVVGITCFTGCGTKSYLQNAPEDAISEEPVESEGESESETASEAQCFVQVSGAVKKPGVYELPAGSRVYQAIEKAGGLCEDAWVQGLNQARVLTDGEMIHVNTTEEQQAKTSMESADDKININTASVKELSTLPGIGETRAQAIIDYRESNGLFSVPEDIKKVSGIGESTYQKFANSIVVD